MHLIQRPCYQQKEVCAKIQQAIGPHEDLLTIQLTQTAVVWLCFPFIRSGQNHLARHSERGKKTRQTKEDNIRELTGLEFAQSQRAVENREKRRKQVAKPSVVPQRPSWLRAR